MKCTFCGGVAHPATGCQYGPSTLACRLCVITFWKWVKQHTNGKASKKQRRVATARTFYESIGGPLKK